MKYFLLDRDYAIKNIARCIGISDTKFSSEEIGELKQQFGTTETIVYFGEDIPHYIEFNSETNTIQEKKIEDEFLKTEQTEKEKIFIEDTVVDPEMLYFYLDKEAADTKGVSVMLATFDKPLLNPDKYLGRESYMFKGKSAPYYVTAVDGTIREATKYEQYKRGQYELIFGEVEYNNDIITLRDGQYIENGELIEIAKPTDLVQPVWKSPNWVEGADRAELIKIRTQKILQYKKLKDEIEILEMFDEFEAPEGIADLKNQLAELKQEINDLLVVINKLKQVM